MIASGRARPCAQHQRPPTGPPRAIGDDASGGEAGVELVPASDDVGAAPSSTAEVAGEIAAAVGGKHPPELSRRKPSPLSGMELWVLLLVPMAWGTWSPATVLLYRQLTLHVPPAPLLNSYFQIVSFSALYATLAAGRMRTGADREEDALLPLNGASAPGSAAVRKEFPGMIRVGAELGMWLFIGSSLQLYGLQFTSANKAAFLVQLTTIFVPVIEGVFLGRRLRGLTWLACLLGLVGVGVLSAGDIGALTGTTLVGEIVPSSRLELLGDACCATSAVFFSIHVIRLGKFAKNLPPVGLACVKAGTQVLLCTLTWSVGAIAGYWKASVSLLDAGTAPAAAWIVAAVVLWNGLVPSAFTVWAQSFGQRVVQPTTANLIYTMQPLWATAFATLILHEEVNAMTYLGGSFIVAASLIAVVFAQGIDGAKGKAGNAGKTR